MTITPPAALASIPAPADATTIHDWDDFGTGRFSRHFTSTAHGDGVKVVGIQHDDGIICRIVAAHIDDVVSPDTARKLAAALVAAADEADQLDEADQ